MPLTKTLKLMVNVKTFSTNPDVSLTPRNLFHTRIELFHYFSYYGVIGIAHLVMPLGKRQNPWFGTDMGEFNNAGLSWEIDERLFEVCIVETVINVIRVRCGFNFVSFRCNVQILKSCKSWNPMNKLIFMEERNWWFEVRLKSPEFPYVSCETRLKHVTRYHGGRAPICVRWSRDSGGSIQLHCISIS